MFHFFFDKGFSTSVDVTIVLYILTNKQFKSMPGVLADPDRSDFLDPGAGGDAQPWDSNNPLLAADYRVDPSAVTVLKKKKFRLIRNVGLDNLDATAGNAPNIRQSVANFTYTHKKVPSLKYDGAAQLPNNYAPYFFAIVYRTDGFPLTDTTLSPNMAVRTELFYKDA